jgi:hypothetical protein
MAPTNSPDGPGMMPMGAKESTVEFMTSGTQCVDIQRGDQLTCGNFVSAVNEDLSNLSNAIETKLAPSPRFNLA